MRAVLFGVILATVSLMLGVLSVAAANPGQPTWVWVLGFAVIGLCLAGIVLITIVKHLLGRRERIKTRIALQVNLAGTWELEQRHRHYAEQLDAFWQSPAGRWVHKAPFLANDSVRIEPIKGGQIPKTYLGLLTLQINDTFVAYVQSVVPLRWNDRVMDFVTWLANHRMVPAWAWRWLGKRLGLPT